MTPLAAGIHRGLAPDRYHGDPAPVPSLSSTLARAMIAQSPRHAWALHPRLNPGHQPAEREAFDLGTAAHTSLLSVGAKVYVVDAPDWLSKEARAERQEARAAGLVPILAEQAEAVARMTSAVRGRLFAMGLGYVFTNAACSEVAALAQIEGCWCRCMVDFVAQDGWLYDLKTTMDASPEAVRRSVESYGYHVQASHYLETWRAAGGEAKGLRFVFVEKSPPHEVTVAELVDDLADPSDWGAIAREQTARARALWRHCLASGDWPGYPAQIVTIGAPAWVGEKWAERKGILEASAPRPKPRAADLRHAMEMQAP